MRIDESSVIWSTPERERAGRELIVLLHGYGSHEGDLFALAPVLPLDAVVASLRAPLAEGPGFAWWSLADQVPGEPAADEADAAAASVLAWIDAQGHESVSVIGFSQGAAVALELLRLAPTRPRRTVALSGFVASASHPGDAELAAVCPAVFWGRGTDDTVIPADAVARTERWLPAHAEATIRVYEHLPHAVSRAELSDVTAFLR
ncbi:dienelactone hydrolase family protein [Galbitalea sp. SE-J8]|uniref:alpha/beta hydrolase n=1 Tax=Galbitalea sp. SE-J8 TaxID=3054952 RepID=UPI00259CC0E2|nr:dienelactone hydrolase family protein [Galbitalea sp. SE-J8]MDM4761573.1 dienelactone hydrolase family protein [Galbitalea sp. SE-J8]